MLVAERQRRVRLRRREIAATRLGGSSTRVAYSKCGSAGLFCSRKRVIVTAAPV
jgi:hypothetical protein